METQYYFRVIMNCILDGWRMLGSAVDGREVLCLLGTDTVYIDIKFVSFQRNNLYLFSGWAHIYLRDADNV